jgi:hypothetical protein
MPAGSRRQFLAALGSAALAGAAGCTELVSSQPDENPGTGSPPDNSRVLEDESMYVLGGDGDLPTPPSTADSLEDATAVLASASADRTALTQALRADKPVAVAGGDAPAALRGLLESVRYEYSFGVETVRGRPVEFVVANPRGDSVDTYTFVADGGWDEPVLDPFGWALAARALDCDTSVPETATGDRFEDAGAAHVVGRLPNGETYCSRSEASVDDRDDGLYVGLRTTLHAAANGGYPIEEAVREADLPDDQHLDVVYPNPHTENGVQIVNVSSPVRSTFGIELTPESSRARDELTGCGGFRTTGGLAYDHRTSLQWKQDTDRRHANATGRGEWRFDGSGGGPR